MNATPCSKKTAEAIESLRLALAEEFSCDFSFTILGRGRILGASNSTHGEVKAIAINADEVSS